VLQGSIDPFVSLDIGIFKIAVNTGTPQLIAHAHLRGRKKGFQSESSAAGIQQTPS
jgi:hypothetical protein